MYHLSSFMKFFEVFREAFLQHLRDASTDVDAIVICLTKKLQKLTIEIRNLKPVRVIARIPQVKHSKY